MAKHIDVEILKSAMLENINIMAKVLGEKNADSYVSVNHVIDLIDGLPAADVQEVRHGRWITSEIATDFGCTSCSCCHSEYYIGDLQNLEGDNDFVMYCPNCGARMDDNPELMGGNL